MDTNSAHLQQNPIRITIPKDKLNFPATQTDQMHDNGGFKIKIPKDLIKPEPSDEEHDSSGNGNTLFSSTSSAPTSLKIKISKDVIGSSGSNAAGGALNYPHASEQTHSSHKKKDKHREKDKSNKVNSF